jgi:hypothetical protein
MVQILANAMATANKIHKKFSSWKGILASAFGGRAFPREKNNLFIEKELRDSSPN